MSRSPLEQVPVRTAAGAELTLGPLGPGELDDLFALFADVVASGDGFPQSPPLTRDVFEATWVDPVTIVVGARPASGDRLLGAYYLKPNFAQRAAHIANAGYVVAAPARGAGIGRRLVEDSIWRAPLVGFDAIQFNLVFASNPARRLYEELGWREIGRIPAAVDGEDALIYWRAVGGAPERTGPPAAQVLGADGRAAAPGGRGGGSGDDRPSSRPGDRRGTDVT